MHELLAVEITKCSDDLITINRENLTDWSEKLQVTPALPGEWLVYEPSPLNFNNNLKKNWKQVLFTFF